MIESGSWVTYGLMFLAPFVAGYFIGDETDRADYRTSLQLGLYGGSVLDNRLPRVLANRHSGCG